MARMTVRQQIGSSAEADGFRRTPPLGHCSRQSLVKPELPLPQARPQTKTTQEEAFSNGRVPQSPRHFLKLAWEPRGAFSCRHREVSAPGSPPGTERSPAESLRLAVNNGWGGGRENAAQVPVSTSPRPSSPEATQGPDQQL